ncbi:MAG: glycosyltransferase family 4 protein [Acidobacteria bacterium]|nr:glycosyltransferase family 4 protein [Acidobacteriota bacterium]
MRIGVDATCWTNRRGYGRFARALLRPTVALDRSNHYIFFVDDESEEFPLPESVEVVRVASDVPTVKAAAADGSRSLRDLGACSRAFSRAGLDLFFFPSVYSYVPMLSRVPQLVTIHDVIPELFPELVFPSLRSKLFWRAKVKVACLQARLILTVSEYSRRCLSEQLKIPADRMRVVNEASDPVFRVLENPQPTPLLERLGLAGATRFLTYVGGFSPHKNLSMLVDVFRDLRSRPGFDDVRLVFGGDYEGDVFFSCYRQLLEQVQQAGLEGKVIFTGYLRDADLLALLNRSQALLLPSFCEGFGLPAIEAAACGAPVVATTRSPLPELLGDGAIILEPEDRAGWTNAVATILTDSARRERMRAAALAAAGKLSWENSAHQLLDIFDEVLHSRVPAA